VIDHSTGLAAIVHQQHEELVRLVDALSDHEYGSACEDHSGTTVAQVAAHCAEGYEQVAVWLQRLTGGAAPAPALDGHHPHPHPHDGVHDEVGLDQAWLASRLRASGRAVIERIGALTEEQLNLVPPASPMADGASRLDTALRGLAGHLQEHLEHLQAAVSRERPE
jgi:hypothetical protein